MNPKGGTEILKEQLIAQLEPGSIDGINLIGSICHPSLVEKDKTNILWQHLSYDQPNVQYMRDRKFVDSIDYFIYVSSWQYNLVNDIPLRTFHVNRRSAHTCGSYHIKR